MDGRVCYITDSAIVKIIDSAVRKGSWLDEVIKKSPWSPVWYDLFINFNIEKADSIVERCEAILENHYGCLDSIADDCELEGISEVVSSDSCFTFLSVFSDWPYIKSVGYGVVVCHNPIPIINWYKQYKCNINNRLYRLLTIFTGPNSGLRLNSADMTDELYFTDKENVRIAMFFKRLDIRGTLRDLIEKGADSCAIERAINFVLYEDPFYDFKADIEGVPAENMPRKKYNSLQR